VVTCTARTKAKKRERRHLHTRSGKCNANVRWHLEFTPWLNAYIEVVASVVLMLEHIWSTHLGTTLKYKVLMSFLRNITIVYSNKGRGLDTLADITLQVVASVVLMLEHIWSTHLGTTLKYKVLKISTQWAYFFSQG
jgi:hypothetical protein